MIPLHRLALGAVACTLAVGVGTTTAASTTALKATMKGSAEAKPGDPDGRGSATVRIKGTQLCYSLRLTDVARTLAGHIHRGKAGVAGPVVVTLYGGKEDRRGCVKVTQTVARKISKSPGSYYVNVHNATYPDGAVRGQLKKG